MTIHRSLKIRTGLLRARNVWTRLERIEALEKQGEHKPGDSVFALPKVRTRFKTKGKGKR